MLAAGFGLGCAIYRFALFGLSWMPHSWGSIDEDGKWEWTGTSLAWTLAVIATILVLTGMAHIAGRLTAAEKLPKRAN